MANTSFSPQALLISFPLILERVFVPGAGGALLALFLMNGIPAMIDQMERGISFLLALKEALAVTLMPLSHSAGLAAPLTTICAGFVLGVLVSLTAKPSEEAAA